MKLLFDGYLMVDWSANSTPKQGKDSIWWCHLCWEGDSLLVAEDNPATRQLAIVQVREILHGYVADAKRLLVGFDFAYAYPQGFAEWLSENRNSSWLSVWKYLNDTIEDDEANRNNRFSVASKINQQLTGKAGPFWGCPKNQVNRYLSMYKPKQDIFPAYRIVEQEIGAHSVWKLAYPGAVGSQVLTGLPYLYALRNDPVLQNHIMVWPFDTGMDQINPSDLVKQSIVFAEIYPSLITVKPEQCDIKDRLQVFALARYFADLDTRHELGALFAGKRVVNKSERDIIEREEGWILGI